MNDEDVYPTVLLKEESARLDEYGIALKKSGDYMESLTFYDSVSNDEFGQTLATGSTHVWSNLFSDPIVGFQYQIDSANKFF